MGERTRQLQELGLDVRTFAAAPVPAAVLKAAFHNRAKQCHPDATAGCTHRFQRLNAAYASLLHDHTHAAFVARAGACGPPHAPGDEWLRPTPLNAGGGSRVRVGWGGGEAVTEAGSGLHAAHAEASHRKWGQLYTRWRGSTLQRGVNNVKLAVVLSAITVGACCVAWCEAHALSTHKNPSCCGLARCVCRSTRAQLLSPAQSLTHVLLGLLL
jgi:hypothetical protein